MGLSVALTPLRDSYSVHLPHILNVTLRQAGHPVGSVGRILLDVSSGCCVTHVNVISLTTLYCILLHCVK